MTKYTRKYLEQTLITLNPDLTPQQVKDMPLINLVYRIQFLLIKYECEPYTQGEIDSLIYH
jgi:hypothetical protein